LTQTFYSVSYYSFGGLGALFGGISPPKPRVGDGTAERSIELANASVYQEYLLKPKMSLKIRKQTFISILTPELPCNINWQLAGSYAVLDKLESYWVDSKILWWCFLVFTRDALVHLPVHTIQTSDRDTDILFWHFKQLHWSTDHGIFL